MRERTTWNRDMIATNAKQADDPRAMNQDHHAQQPAADAYVTGGPSEFAEDVHPPAGTWKAEYAGGEVKRNEIGMPEMRGDTYNHPEKTAAEQALTVKKADLCVKIARVMLPKTASESEVEDQALALMNLPDAELIQTSNRLAQQQGDDDDEEEEEQAQQQQQQAQGQGGQQSSKKAQDDDEDDDEEQKQASAALQAAMASGNAAAVQALVQKLAAIQVRRIQAAQQKQEQDQEQQADQQQGDKEAFSMADQMQQQAIEADQMQQQQAQGQQQQMTAEQVQQMVAEQVQQALQGQQQQQMGCGDMMMAGGVPQGMAMSDEQMLDAMLQEDLGQPGQQMMANQVPVAGDFDVQLEGAHMDIGETVLGEEDAVLQQLFASDTEVQLAAHAEELQTGINPLHGIGAPAPAAPQGFVAPAAPAPVTAGVRTASTVQPRAMRTVPTSGVSQLGGGAAGGDAGPSDIDKLSSMWRSAPDVSGVFSQ